jgi:hypothetical protein
LLGSADLRVESKKRTGHDLLKKDKSREQP